MNYTTRTVRVVHRFGEWGMNIKPVTVEWICPKCGQPRGEPYNYNFCEDGEWFSCDRWDNPCGHIDLYPDVIAEEPPAADAWGDDADINYHDDVPAWAQGGLA